MSLFRRIEILDPYCCPPFATESYFCTRKSLGFPSFFLEEDSFALAHPLDLLTPIPDRFEVFDTVTDLIQVQKTPSLCSYRRIQQRAGTELYLQTLSDRVSTLESRIQRLISAKKCGGERKYTVTAEIKGPVERKYQWTAEIKDGKKKKKEEKKKAGVEKNYKWTAEIKGRDEENPISRKYTFEISNGNADECNGSGKKDKKEKKEKKEKKGDGSVRLIEIQEPNDHGTVVLRQAFAKRPGVIRARKGKQTELSPEEAALLIQLTFRAYLIRRSQALRALRELAIAKAKLKEIRALFNNFSYRRQVARDAEERQRFSEKIIVLLLTVDAIEGADIMVRASKRSMVDELEAMLDAVDPQPQGKLLSMKRRTFDMPDGSISKEIAQGVAQVVQMIDEDENRARAFEACV